MNILLRVKAYQLFLIYVFSVIFSTDGIAGRIIFCLSVCINIVWIYSIGLSMNKLIPEKFRPKIAYFKASCLLILVWITVALTIFGGYSINQDNYAEYGNWLWVLIPAHLYLMWSFFYMFYFASKMLNSVIDGEIVGFSTYYRTFFAMWIFPIGVWFIQPAVQRILASKSE